MFYNSTESRSNKENKYAATVEEFASGDSGFGNGIREGCGAKMGVKMD